MHQDNIAFEQAFARLEEILEKMNEGALSLEESLRLYEEADKLIQLCNHKLLQAETKIEMLVKNREGIAVACEESSPSLQPFPPTCSSGLS